MLGVAVHPGAVLARLLLHLWPGDGEAFVGHAPQQEGVGRGQLVEPELVPFGSPRSNWNDHAPRSNPSAPPGSSMTPSSETNSDTITLLVGTSFTLSRIFPTP